MHRECSHFRQPRWDALEGDNGGDTGGDDAGDDSLEDQAFASRFRSSGSSGTTGFTRVAL